MTDPKEKPKPVMREARPKKSLNLHVRRPLPPLRDPHEELIKPSTPSQTSPSSQASPTPVAPVRDFSKVANSIQREAVPSGLFKGKSKQLYDCLYALTRGAIVPTRTVRISRPQLMKKAHIGARVTFESNIEHLSNIGLVQVRQIVGEHEGNEYTVFLPEEASMPSHTSQGSQGSQTSHAQKQDVLVSLESSQTRHTLSSADSTVSDTSKTSFKTKEQNLDDDAALAPLREVERELTGKESAGWREVMEVLAAELKIAAARTTVSSPPAFLAEHLRRRLWKLDKRQAEAQGRELPDQVSSAPPEAIDARSCPDCGGSGWHYAEGYDKPVRKCRHEKLKQPEN